MASPTFIRVNVPPLLGGGRPGVRNIVDAIQNELCSGLLPPESKLPPVRVLAHQLGVAKGTIEAAYDELTARGIVYSKARQGVFVTAVPPAFLHDSQGSEAPAPSMRNITDRGLFPPKNLILLSEVKIDYTLLPQAQLNDCAKSALKSPGFNPQPDIQGYTPLREFLADWLSKRGVPAKPSDIITTNGTQMAVSLVLNAVEKKSVACESPTFELSARMFGLLQCPISALKFDPFAGIDFSAWDRVLAQTRPSLIYLTSSFNNPTGYSFSSSEICKILELAKKYQAGIIEDDWGSELMSHSEYRPPFRAFGGKNVFYVNSFNKKLNPGLRVGYLVGNSVTMPHLCHAKRVLYQNTSVISEATLYEFLHRGYYKKWLKEFQEVLDFRYRNCLRTLEASMPAYVKWTRPGGGTALWLELGIGFPILELESIMATRGYHIRPCKASFIDEQHLNGIRIGYCWLNENQLQNGLEVLAKEIKRLRSF